MTADEPALGVLGTNAHRARGWSECLLCGRTVAPGERIALPPGGSRYAHVPCIAGLAAAPDQAGYPLLQRRQRRWAGETAGQGGDGR